MTQKDTPSSIDLSKAFLEGADMSDREEEILHEIVAETDFKPEKIIWRSSYWGTKQIGAAHYLGTFDARPAVLKIQGVKPDVSEVFMIKQFDAQNRSSIIRPPYILETVPWNDDAGYEGIITEHVTGEKVLQSGQLQTADAITGFLDMYHEYRENCIPQKPWLPQPESIDWDTQIERALDKSEKAYPNDPRRKPEDRDLVIKAGKVLKEAYLDVDRVYLHGHFSVEDLIRQGDEVVLFSNLFWKWQFPFYDAVFGYHWFMYELGKVEGITPEQIEEQRELWLGALHELRDVKGDPENQRLLKAALLERATAGVIIDSLLVDPDSPVANYLRKSTRNQVEKLCSELRSKVK